MSKARRRRPPIIEVKPQDRAIAELDLPVRIANALEKHHILYVDQLLQQKPSFFGTIPNFGDSAFRELKQTLSRHGVDYPANWRRKLRRRA
ncbi:hypothetical protein KIH39_22850 [Telmatocola sphagniphila]|uniref:RNA polymerase alpha subunit C-terminal domain-containing protein n=1 Tax=Telmatocola sphagniphila TaxID=1123043 RepID=A0A8E6B6X0_9BACT|nr:DNA-directed RNA polymerase subunit alpha C-terminal domain-containing protein [Telmatocola sphagniphila]QVL31653.1 hypothetical protein KIH39_22850 [Telmatocola sphagniphila]